MLKFNMSEESKNLLEQNEQVDGAFRYYRERGFFFLNTVIIFSSTVLGWIWGPRKRKLKAIARRKSKILEMRLKNFLKNQIEFLSQRN
ncbi:hypothetical protein UZ36_00815 [Candidatus Nitromaritima sp. SCGC AAA799-C22]|nr:hypothetical protein UZ36_00815 [Candidatus Nitromaritima sp. SCGC AAA799-C22]